MGKEKKDETQVLPLGFALKYEFDLGAQFLNMKSTNVWTVIIGLSL